MAIKKVGIVGCGQMGSGIALVCAQAGLQVIARILNRSMSKKVFLLWNPILRRASRRGKCLSPQKKRLIPR